MPDPADPTRSLLVDGQRTRGVELSVGGNVTPAWSVVGAYAYQDGEITRSLSATAQAGAALAQLPENSLSLWNRYDFTRRAGAGLGVIHRSEVFTSTDNTVTLPAFTRLDAALFALDHVEAAGAGERRERARHRILRLRAQQQQHHARIPPRGPRGADRRLLAGAGGQRARSSSDHRTASGPL